MKLKFVLGNILVFFLVFFSYHASSADEPKSVTQSTEGKSSPVYHASDDMIINVTNEGFSKLQFDTLMNAIESLRNDYKTENEIIDNVNEILDNLMILFKQESEKISKRMAEIDSKINSSQNEKQAEKARELLQSGDIDGAEQTVTMRGVKMVGGSINN